MAAILSCARTGISLQNATLYCSTFPCHNCAKHIIGSGIKRVVYIEPYPKSKSMELYQDAIVLADSSADGGEQKRVRFEEFVGIGPRRFFDLFSMNTRAVSTSVIPGNIGEMKQVVRTPARWNSSMAANLLSMLAARSMSSLKPSSCLWTGESAPGKSWSSRFRPGQGLAA